MLCDHSAEHMHRKVGAQLTKGSPTLLFPKLFVRAPQAFTPEQAQRFIRFLFLKAPDQNCSVPASRKPC